MSILDKLMEKKDLQIYLELRKEEIHKNFKKEIKTIPENRRNLFTYKVHGKITELETLIHLISTDQLKDMCKKKYQSLDEQGFLTKFREVFKDKISNN